MISTGVEALDARIGGLVRGRSYLFTGPAGAGKSTAALHFLHAGLERGERCLLVTEGNRRALDGQARFLGLGPGRFTDAPGLRLLDLSETARLGWAGATQALGLELEKQPADRIVIDSIRPFVRDAATPEQALEALYRLLERTNATRYVLVPTTGPDAPGLQDLEPLRQASAIVFEIVMNGTGEREFRLQQVTQAVFRADAFRFQIRPDAGISEHLGGGGADGQDTAVHRTVAVLDQEGLVTPEVLGALEESYRVSTFSRGQNAFRELVQGSFGVIIISLDPYDADHAFDLTFALRKAGNQAPIIFLSPSRGLRSTTRARGLRTGGDDFLVAELSTTEIMERLRLALIRGHRRRMGGLDADERIVQPMDQAGEPRPMSHAELLNAIQALLGQDPKPFFALYILDAGVVLDEEFWPQLRESVRILDGDLVGHLDGGRMGVILLQLDRALADRLGTRFRGLHPELEQWNAVQLLVHPDSSDSLPKWLQRNATTLPAEA